MSMYSKAPRIIDTYKTKDIFVWTYQFKVPLFYETPLKGQINVVAKIIQLYSKTSPISRLNGPVFEDADKVVTFLQGGPGFPAESPISKSGFLSVLLDKGYTVVNYDQRGTGLSTPLDFTTLSLLGKKIGLLLDINANVDDYVHLLSAFRADLIVRDCEEIRKALFAQNPKKKWSIQGQSYGGFCCHTYMSLFPDSLEEVLMTGGIPGVGLSVEDVYKATYKRTVQRNTHYYSKYPKDIARVKRIVKHLDTNTVDLPNGGVLSVERFQQLGLTFGGSSGTDRLHLLVLQMTNDLDCFEEFTYNTLQRVQDYLGFETNPIYALFQEAIYMDGPGHCSNWCADRLRYLPENKPLFVVDTSEEDWENDNEKRVFFTGEMVFKLMYDDYSELRKFKKLAYALHSYDGWSKLYDISVLRTVYDSMDSFYQKRLLVPENERVDKKDVHIIKVAAAVYYNDQYVDFYLSQHTAEKCLGSVRLYVTSEYFHNGLGADPTTVMGKLFLLLDEEVD